MLVRHWGGFFILSLGRGIGVRLAGKTVNGRLRIYSGLTAAKLLARATNKFKPRLFMASAAATAAETAAAFH